MNLRELKLNAVGKAAILHRELGISAKIREGHEQIDIFQSLHDLGVTVLCRPLSGFLGAYIPGEVSGILVSNKISPARQRFTAAHELGHYYLNHQKNSIDTEELFRNLQFEPNSCPEFEYEADSFAAEFLIPKSLIAQISRKQSWNKTDFLNPEITYQLSLRMGVSFSATKYALVSHGLITLDQANKYLDLSLVPIKEKLVGKGQLENSQYDVHHILDKDDRRKIIARDKDTLIVDLNEHSSSGYMWIIKDMPENINIVADGELNPGHRNSNEEIGDTFRRRMKITGAGLANISFEEIRAWEANGNPINHLNISVNFDGKESGLPKVARI